MNALLAFQNVWLEYGEKIVLERVSLGIAERSFVSIVGPSGAGKSSFLRLALGQEAPSRGQILLDGKRLAAECGPDRGVVFQRYSVFPHLTALRNVMFGRECVAARVTGHLFGAARRRAAEEAEAMLAEVGLADARDLYPAQLSGGMQQRLAIAQALITRPRVLLLDEPFGALDPGIRKDMHRLILRLWREHDLTVLMVTHDIAEAFKLGTRVLAFDKRRIDPHAPHRFGATAVYDLPLKSKLVEAPANSIESITIDRIGNNKEGDKVNDAPPASLARLSMSLPAELSRQLDAMVEERGLPSRSQLIAELIRNELAEHGAAVRPDDMLAGTITLVYRGDMGRVRHQLAQTQAEYLKEVISSQHVFLEDDQSLEVTLVQGPATRLRDLCDALRKVRGVRQLRLVTTTALLPPLHEQDRASSLAPREAA